MPQPPDRSRSLLQCHRSLASALDFLCYRRQYQYQTLMFLQVPKVMRKEETSYSGMRHHLPGADSTNLKDSLVKETILNALTRKVMYTEACFISSTNAGHNKNAGLHG